jgi:threonine synthase
MHGAVVVAIRGNFDEALHLVREISAKHPIKLVNSVNPFRIEGQKTGSFEIIEALEDAPHFHSLPVGNAGNITAYWKGYTEWHEAGKASRKPTMLGFQAEGAAPIVRGHVVKDPETVATAIRIGNPASWKYAEAARDESGGVIDMVSEEEILTSQRDLAQYDGVFGEPACAAPIAGVTKLFNAGYFEEALEANNGGPLSVVCTITGHGLKDPDTAIKQSGEIIETDADEDAILKIALGTPSAASS